MLLKETNMVIFFHLALLNLKILIKILTNKEITGLEGMKKAFLIFILVKTKISLTIKMEFSQKLRMLRWSLRFNLKDYIVLHKLNLFLQMQMRFILTIKHNWIINRKLMQIMVIMRIKNINSLYLSNKKMIASWKIHSNNRYKLIQI